MVDRLQTLDKSIAHHLPHRRLESILNDTSEKNLRKAIRYRSMNYLIYTSNDTIRRDIHIDEAEIEILENILIAMVDIYTNQH